MFGIGWQELGLIAVVALLVLGPKELPGLMRMAGEVVRKARAAADELRAGIETIDAETELEDYRRIAMKKADDVQPLISSPPAETPASAGEAHERD